MANVTINSLANSPAFAAYKAAALGSRQTSQTQITGPRLAAVGIVHNQLLPLVVSRMLDSRAAPGTMQGWEEDWVTRTDIFNQLKTVEILKGAFNAWHFVGEEKSLPPVDRELTLKHLRGWSVVVDGVDGTSFYARKNKNKFGPLSFLLPDHVEYAYQMFIMYNGIPQYAGIFAPELKANSENPVSIFEAVAGFPGAYLNGRPLQFAATGPLEGSTPLMSFIGCEYGDALRKHLSEKFFLNHPFNMVSAVSCETMLLARRPEFRNDYSFALYSARAARLWDWGPGAFIFDQLKEGALLLKPTPSGFRPTPIFPITPEKLVFSEESGNYEAGFKWPILYAGRENARRIAAAMNDWPEYRKYFFRRD